VSSAEVSWLRGIFGRVQWRKRLRALHRDAGYLAIGLTLIYALSGIAINHIADWDPNFTALSETHPLPESAQLPAQLPVDDPATARRTAQTVVQTLKRRDHIKDAYAVDEQHLDITLEHTTLYVDLSSRAVREEGQKPRLLLRAANWLHLNRGKKAWTYIADGYATFLLFLAVSGLFMLPGKNGIRGRGAVLALAGAAIPVLYVALSGGP
jgi:hypothetical protein